MKQASQDVFELRKHQTHFYAWHSRGFKTQSKEPQLRPFWSFKHLDDVSNDSELPLGPFVAMASPAMLGSRALRASQTSLHTAAPSRRGLAAAASGSFQYETGDASGVKFASRDVPGATTTLAVVARGGTRFQPYPGYSDALEKFAFKVRNRDPRSGCC